MQVVRGGIVLTLAQLNCLVGLFCERIIQILEAALFKQLLLRRLMRFLF